VVQATEGCGRYTDAEVVGPAPYEGVEPFHEGADGLARESPPFGAQACPQPLGRVRARRDQQLVPRSCAWRFVAPDGESQEVEALSEVDDAGLVLGEGQPALGQPVPQDDEHPAGVLSGLTAHD